MIGVVLKSMKLIFFQKMTPYPEGWGGWFLGVSEKVFL